VHRHPPAPFCAAAAAAVDPAVDPAIDPAVDPAILVLPGRAV